MVYLYCMLTETFKLNRMIMTVQAKITFKPGANSKKPNLPPPLRLAFMNICGLRTNLDDIESFLLATSHTALPKSLHLRGDRPRELTAGEPARAKAEHCSLPQSRTEPTEKLLGRGPFPRNQLAFRASDQRVRIQSLEENASGSRGTGVYHDVSTGIQSVRALHVPDNGSEHQNGAIGG